MTDHWHILGTGAIGSLFACSLHRGGIPTILLCRDGTSPGHKIDICMESARGTERLSFPTSINADSTAISHLLVTTKAYDVHAALSEVEHRLNAASQIVVLVNGMGFMEELKERYGQLNFTLGTTTQGVYRVDSGHFFHAGDGLTRLGKAGVTSPPAWFNGWSQLDIATTWESDIEQILWQKLCVNCAINPVTAVYRCKNGELATRPELASKVRFLCDEIARVSLAAGYDQVAHNIHHIVSEVITDTAGNRSSMLQDVLAGRRTEIDFISGHLISLAKQFELATPHNSALFEQIKNLQN